MGKKSLHKHLPALKTVSSLKPKLRRQLLANCSDEFIHCLCECAHNLSKGTVPVDSTQFKKIDRHRNKIRALLDKDSNKEKRRSFLIQKGGFLPLLLAPILAALGTFAGEKLASVL